MNPRSNKRVYGFVRCEQCGKSVQVTGNRQRFCPQCAKERARESAKRCQRRIAAMKKMREVTCVDCGRRFSTLRKNAVRCDECRGALYRGEAAKDVARGTMALRANANQDRREMMARLAKRDAEYAAKFGNKGRIEVENLRCSEHDQLVNERIRDFY